MKSKHLIIIALIAIFAIVSSCITDDNSKSSTEAITPTVDSDLNRPLNISVFLDLSDRLDRDLVPSQFDRDTAIIGTLVQLFMEDCIHKGRIINSENHFQIFFHPVPKSTEIATLASGLNFDMSSTPIAEKKKVLVEMREKISTNVSQIYQNTLAAKSWPGSDIWAFFTDKKVDTQCIRKGYRNILVILTDGYLYYEHNKRQNGNAYSYVLPQTLKDPESSLIVGREGLDNLEVLLLEVNPYEPLQRNKLIQVLEGWFKGMGVTHFVVADTDLPVNTETVIKSFIKQ